MNKKTIIIIAVSVLVIGGVYYGINRWRQQRLANQILNEVYGINTGGLLDKITGGGKITNQIAQQMAKEAAKQNVQQKVDEAKEASKTPEDKYNDAEEMPTYDANSKAIASGTKNIVEKVFGKAKLTTISTSVYSGDMSGSGVVGFKISRLATGADLGTLNKAITDSGLSVIQSGISDKTATIMAGSYESTLYTFSFEIGEQDVGINIIKTGQ